MSNYFALGFEVGDRRALEGLARAPLRRADPHLALGDESLRVHRWEVGGGVELWSIVRGQTVAASFPFFLAQTRRTGTVEQITHPHGPLTPRLWLQGRPPLVLHWANAPLMGCSPAPGTTVEVAVALLVPGPWERSEAAPGRYPAPPDRRGRLAEIVQRVVGEVRAVARLANAATGVELAWLRLGVGDGEELEAVGRAANLPADLEVGSVWSGIGTLRGALTAVREAS
ncbi:MAG: hypothetical protein IT204_09930 [Fimbriimonadaceae bacterium]|nr:hypothetical protein [Fimbriimonadaceae bacterium]